MANIVYEKTLNEDYLKGLLKTVSCRGIYDQSGIRVRPYKNAKFSLATVYPPKKVIEFPHIEYRENLHPLFTAQPTIYEDITDIMREVDAFLKTINKRIHALDFEAIQYDWEGRGKYHILPPVIEKHTYPLKKGKIDLDKLTKEFEGYYVCDAKKEFHKLSERFLTDFYIDTHTKVRYLDVFNPNLELISYGLGFNGLHDFHIICDGSHRLDYAIQIINKPINVIIVESENLIPYYALPMPFFPLTRLTSKIAERKYNLERDKVHLMSGLLKKFLHYDWETAGLFVSKLRRKELLDFL